MLLYITCILHLCHIFGILHETIDFFFLKNYIILYTHIHKKRQNYDVEKLSSVYFFIS